MDSTTQKEPEIIEVDQIDEGKKYREFPTFIDLVAIFGVFILSQILGVLLVKIALPHLMPTLSDSLAEAMVMLLTQVLSMSATIIFILIMRRSRHAQAAPIGFSLGGFNPTILLGGVLMLISMSVVIEPLLSLLPPPPSFIARGWPLLLTVVVGAPLFEEFICRGLILESVRAKRGVVVAWLVSSLFFALLHVDPAMVVNAFFMGLVLGFIYIRSQSIVAPIILHAINNAIAYLCIVLGVGGDNGSVMLRDLIPSDSVYYVVYGVAALILIISTVVCVRQFKKIIDGNQSENEEQAEAIEEVSGN
ncbi:MAG: type II CAAX endopeptidase family protein [Rikenellaceae bacterium]